MLKILKILRRADQNNCLNMVHTITTQLTQGNTETSSEGLLNIQDPQVTFKGLSDLFIKYILEAIVTVLHIYSRFLQEKQKQIFICSKWGHPRNVYQQYYQSYYQQFYNITNNILELAYLNCDQFEGVLESYLRGSFTVAMFFFLCHLSKWNST